MSAEVSREPAPRIKSDVPGLYAGTFTPNLDEASSVSGWVAFSEPPPDMDVHTDYAVDIIEPAAFGVFVEWVRGRATQRSLAKLAKIGQPAISLIEAGGTTGFANARRIYQALGGRTLQLAYHAVDEIDAQETSPVLTMPVKEYGSVVGQFVREQRKQRRWSQQQLADAAGTNPGQIAMFERAQTVRGAALVPDVGSAIQYLSPLGIKTIYFGFRE